MTHDQIKSKLQDFMEGIVDESEKMEIQNHLSQCTDCMDELTEINDLVLELNAIPQLEPPTGLKNAVMSKIRNEKTHYSILELLSGMLPKIGYAYAFGMSLVLMILSKIYLMYSSSPWSSLSYAGKFSSTLVGVSKGSVDLLEELSGLWIVFNTFFNCGFSAISAFWIVEIVLMITSGLYYFLRKHKSMHLLLA